MSDKHPTRSWFIILLVLVIIVPAGWFVVLRMEGEDPAIEISPERDFIGSSQTIHLRISDPKSGLKKVQMNLEKDGKQALLHMKTFPSMGFGQAGTVDTTTVDVLIAPKELGFSDGEAVLRVEVWDYAWRNWWHGNKREIEKKYVIDTKPPEAEVLTRTHYLNQGGAGLVIYKLSEACSKTGVAVGDAFYPGLPGYFKNPDIFMAFFAVAYDQGSETKVFIQSTDPAGNVAQARFYHGIQKKAFKTDNIAISDDFLNRKMPEFDIEGVPDDTMTPIEKFIQVNRKVRKANYAAITQVARQPENTLYWDQNRFLRFPGSARRASFADKRIYLYKGKQVDQQTHMGVDLASTQQADVPAGNTGKVVFAGSEGIYGNTVILDHGFGLFSLYCHLSHIGVKNGEIVSRGDIIGRTGATGMAAGDHLHFSMMVHHTFVNPDEWWDANWIENNITSKINRIRSEWDKD